MAAPVVEQLVEQRVFVLRGITLVPHYNSEGFVAPGYGRHHAIVRSASELYAMGAKEELSTLWPRPRLIRKETLQ